MRWNIDSGEFCVLNLRGRVDTCIAFIFIYIYIMFVHLLPAWGPHRTNFGTFKPFERKPWNGLPFEDDKLFWYISNRKIHGSKKCSHFFVFDFLYCTIYLPKPVGNTFWKLNMLEYSGHKFAVKKPTRPDTPGMRHCGFRIHMDQWTVAKRSRRRPLHRLIVDRMSSSCWQLYNFGCQFSDKF